MYGIVLNGGKIADANLVKNIKENGDWLFFVRRNIWRDSLEKSKSIKIDKNNKIMIKYE